MWNKIIRCGAQVLAPCEDQERLVGDIRKELLLLIGIAKRLFGAREGADSQKTAFNESLRSLIISYSHYLQAGNQQVEKLRHFKGLGDDAETRMGHKNSAVLLTNLKHGADKLAAEMAKVRSAQKALQSDDSDSQRETPIRSDELMGMMDLFVEDVFRGTETDMYQDCVAWQAASRQRDLQKKADDLVAVACGYQAGGEHDWKSSLPAGASLDDIFSKSSSLLTNVDIRKLRQAGEDCGAATGLQEFA